MQLFASVITFSKTCTSETQSLGELSKLHDQIKDLLGQKTASDQMEGNHEEMLTSGPQGGFCNSSIGNE